MEQRTLAEAQPHVPSTLWGGHGARPLTHVPEASSKPWSRPWRLSSPPGCCWGHWRRDRRRLWNDRPFCVHQLANDHQRRHCSCCRCYRRVPVRQPRLGRCTIGTFCWLGGCAGTLFPNRQPCIFCHTRSIRHARRTPLHTGWPGTLLSSRLEHHRRLRGNFSSHETPFSDAGADRWS